MLSIGQFSKVCQVSVKTLHHYDKIHLVAPFYVEPFTGYRYYDESQIPLMLLIQRLKRYGFSLSEIRDFTACDDEKVLFSKLKRKEQELIRHMEEASFVLKEIQRHMKDFERTGDIMGYQKQYGITTTNTEDMAILSSRQVMSVEEFGMYYGKIFETLTKEHLTMAGNVLSIYHDEEFNPDETDIELSVPIAEKEKATRILKGTLCAKTVHQGPYSGLPDAYGALTQWIDQNGYEIAGCPFEIYIKTQFDHLPAEDWVTNVYFPIEKRS